MEVGGHMGLPDHATLAYAPRDRLPVLKAAGRYLDTYAF